MAQRKVAPFAAGTRAVPMPITQWTYVPGQQVSYVLPKSGFLSALRFRFSGTVTVGVAGAATTPRLERVIGNYLLSANYGYQYRNLDGDTLKLKTELENPFVSNAVTAAGTWRNYNPASATAQPVNFVLEDHVDLNDQLNFDRFLISAQTIDSDRVIQITFGQQNDIIAETGTETITTVAGTLFLEGLYFTVPDTSRYALPNTAEVQQCLVDTSYTGVVVGTNTINLTPVQGPRYAQIAFKPVFNGVSDSVNFASAITGIRLRANNQEDLLNYSGQALIWRMASLYRKSFPPGWFVLDFLSDIGIPNQASPLMRDVVSTEAFSTLWLNVDVANGTTLGATPVIKLFKRIVAPVLL